MLLFKKIKRKPTFVEMAKVDAKTAKELMKNGIKSKAVSFADEDKEMITNAKEDATVGFIATDGESYWFINYDFAKKNYEIE